ncbi:MAG: hypothetical protein ACRD51_07240 [Candidatus Acidiferrum sp.]
MANYSIKVRDHTAAANTTAKGIVTELQAFFTKVFAGTSDRATVVLGTGTAADAIVLHFVESRSNSYIAAWLGAAKLAHINERAGGHTTTHNNVTCSEFYQTAIGRDHQSRTLSAHECAKLGFHESLHNVHPDWDGEGNLKGHGGLADTPVGADLNQRDIDLLRQGIASRHGTTQKL